MKRTFLILLLVFAIIFSLASCKDSSSDSSGDENGADVSDTNTPSDDDGTEDDEYIGAIYSPKTDTHIVKPSSDTMDLLPLIERICDLSGKIPMLIGDDHSEKDHEIVIGDTKRDISKKAIKIMTQRMEDDNSDADGLVSYYCIYSDGDSVALVFSDEYAFLEGMDYFMKNYVYSKSLALAAGHSEIKSFSRIDRMREEERF